MKASPLASTLHNRLFIPVVVIAVVAVAIASYYIFMPAWIIAIRGDDRNALPDIQNRFEIDQSDLTEFPELAETIAVSNESHSNERWIGLVQTWSWEGNRIIEKFDMDSEYPPEYEAVLIHHDNQSGAAKVYHVQIIFGYERPNQG